MTENRARVLEVLTCSQIASRPSINKSLRWIACKCSAKYKAQPPPLRPLRSSRNSFIPSMFKGVSSTVSSRWVSVIASTSNLHNNCKHLNSSILFLKLQMFKCATFRSLAEHLDSWWTRSVKGLSHSSSFGSMSESGGVWVPITEENESSDNELKGKAVSRSDSSNPQADRGWFNKQLLQIHVFGSLNWIDLYSLAVSWPHFMW